MQRQKQRVNQEVTQTSCLKTTSANVPGRAFECDIHEGQLLTAEKDPQGHSNAEAGLSPGASDGNRDTWLPCLSSSGPPLPSGECCHSAVLRLSSLSPP